MEGGGGLADRNLVIGSEGKIGLLGGGGWYWIEINVIIGGWSSKNQPVKSDLIHLYLPF